MSTWDDLRAAAERRPDWPWLFFREGIDWRWRSYRQVADHLARAAGALATRPEPAFAYSARVAVDALGAGLAILAAGRRALPWREGEEDPAAPYALIEASKPRYREPSPTGVAPCMLPAPASLLQAGAPSSLADTPGGSLSWGGRALRLAEVEQEVGLLAGRIQWQGPGGRAIFHLGTGLGAPLDHAVLALTLRGHAALALEPFAEALVPSILWCRPSHLALTPAEAEQLAHAWSERDAKRSRLRQLLVAPGAGAADLQSWGNVFGVAVETLPEL